MTATHIQQTWATALESSRGLLSVPACWRDRLDQDYEAFRRAFLSQSSQAATSYPCPQGCGCMHEIVRAPSEGKTTAQPEEIAEESHAMSVEIVAVCRCPEPHCADIPLEPSEAVLQELSWTKLARGLCAALNLDYKPADLGLLNTRQIGAWPANNIPVILTIQTDHAWFRGVILELIVRLRSKFILLAPTARHFDAVCQELLSHNGAVFCPLEGNVRLAEDGLLEAVRLPGELFANATSDEVDDSEAEVAQCAFGLVQQLETDSKRQPPMPLTVFRLFCVQGWNASRIARHTGCSRATVLRRLELIEKRTGMSAASLRRYSAHLETAREQALRSRARRSSVTGEE